MFHERFDLPERAGQPDGRHDHHGATSRRGIAASSADSSTLANTATGVANAGRTALTLIAARITTTGTMPASTTKRRGDRGD